MKQHTVTNVGQPLLEESDVILVAREERELASESEPTFSLKVREHELHLLCQQPGHPVMKNIHTMRN